MHYPDMSLCEPRVFKKNEKKQNNVSAKKYIFADSTHYIP